MIKSKKDLKEYIKTDRLVNGLNKSYIYIMYLLKRERYIVIYYLRVLRKLEYYINCNKKIRKVLYYLKLWRLQSKYNIKIWPNSCGKGLKIPHLVPVLINAGAKCGDYLTINAYSAIVISGTDGNYSATIGNHCLIGTGAKIIGPITIGDYTVIAANATVTKDFTEGNYTIGGTPAKVISNHSAKDAEIY